MQTDTWECHYRRLLTRTKILYYLPHLLLPFTFIWRKDSLGSEYKKSDVVNLVLIF